MYTRLWNVRQLVLCVKPALPCLVSFRDVSSALRGQCEQTCFMNIVFSILFGTVITQHNPNICGCISWHPFGSFLSGERRKG